MPDDKFIESVNDNITELSSRLRVVEDKVLAKADKLTETLELLTKLSEV